MISSLMKPENISFNPRFYRRTKYNYLLKLKLLSSKNIYPIKINFAPQIRKLPHFLNYEHQKVDICHISDVILNDSI
jgi:hypothetical protein